MTALSVYFRNLLAIAAVFAVTASANAQAFKNAGELAREAGAAYQQGDIATAIDKFEQALEYRPHYRFYLFNLAYLTAEAGDHEAALAWLDKYADLGMTADIEGQEVFVPLKALEGFQAVADKIKANGQPKGNAVLAVELQDNTLLNEGLLYDPARDVFFVGTIYGGRLIEVSRDGALRDVIDPGAGGAWGIMGMSLEPDSGFIWASSSNLFPYQGEEPEKGLAGLFVIDPATGEVVRSILPGADALEGDHVFGDVIFDSKGNAYTTDSLTPALYKAEAGGDTLELVVQSDEFVSLHGMAFSPDGKILVFTDYARGLFAWDTESGELRHIAESPKATVRGIDGFYAYKDGFIAVQNGTSPHRVIFIRLSDDYRTVESAQVLEQAHDLFHEPTLGSLDGDTFYLIANSGWPAFNKPLPAKDDLLEKVEPLKILKIDLKAALAK